MNQPNSTIRCPQCSFLNFASEAFCKRCKISLQNNNFSADTNSVNINITLPASVQPRINIQQNNGSPNNQPYQQPQFNQPPQHADNRQSSEYQLLNQTGFQQWQQENRQMNPPMQNPNYPPPGYSMMNSGTVWRRGGELVVHRYAANLPDCCVKCGEQIGGYAGGAYISQKFRWHNPLVYIALISPLIYCILAAVLSERVRVEIPLCSKHLEARKSTGKTLLSSGVAAMVAIFFFGSFGYIGFSFLLFFAALIGIVLGYEYAYKPLQISKIENDYIYLKNADNGYLNRLPPC
jgi:hypothetical protein